MARPDRGVAQRYASKKRKKRVSAHRIAGSVVERIREPEGLDESAVPGRLTSARRRAEPLGSARLTPPAPMAQSRLISKRPFSSYADQYQYVLGDLRRVALVAGTLLLGLIALSFFIR